MIYLPYCDLFVIIAYLSLHITHWGRVTHICVGKLTIIGSDNVLSPGRRQAIIWTNDGILLIWLLGTNFSEILSEIHSFSFKKMHLKMSSGKGRPFCLGLNVLTHWPLGDAVNRNLRIHASEFVAKLSSGGYQTENTIDDKSTLFQAVAWCRQATSNCLHQWWPRFMCT